MSHDRIVLGFDGITLAPGKAPVSGQLRMGEIAGLAGLEGQGQEEFLLHLAGFRPRAPGQVTAHGPEGAHPLRNHHEAARQGVTYLPRDRRATGIFPVLSVLDNFGISALRRFSRLRVIDRRRQREELARQTEFLSIRYLSMGAPITALSGGNQQKVLLARMLALKPRVMLLNDPTRGVDLNTRLKVYEAFRQLARDEGIAFVILSSEIEEILQICDNVSIFRDFERTQVIPKAEMSMSAVMAAMFGQKEDAA
ncbi:MAG: ATP-binding cassette domain-containing protein [Paracoccus sp. (in: a-proteobacteria)]